MDVVLTELQRIPTSGARAVETFAVGGHELLAVPQLALDVPGEKAAMNGGDSDTELLLLRRVDERFVPFATLPASGGEDAEFFTIGDRSFLAVASIRSGSGPYRYAIESTIFVWQDEGFVPFQTHRDVRRQAVQALEHRRPALPRTRPGRPASGPRARQPTVGGLRVGRDALRRVPARGVGVGVQLARVPRRGQLVRRARGAPGPERALPLGRPAAASRIRS